MITRLRTERNSRTNPHPNLKYEWEQRVESNKTFVALETYLRLRDVDASPKRMRTTLVQNKWTIPISIVEKK